MKVKENGEAQLTNSNMAHNGAKDIRLHQLDCVFAGTNFPGHSNWLTIGHPVNGFSRSNRQFRGSQPQRMKGQSGSFHGTFWPILAFAQFSGVMPLRGMFGSDRESLRFTWTNPVHLYAIGVSAVALFFDAAFTRENLQRTFSVDSFASTVFYTVCLLTSAIFLQVARKMPEVARDFLHIEDSMPEYKPPRRLALLTNSILLVFVPLATVEHGTMAVLHLYRALEVAKNGTDNVGHSFYEMHLLSVSRIVPYSGLMTIVFTWANAICTFNWNFLDFFLMGISLQLVAKFNQVNGRIVERDFDKRNPAQWEKVRTDYARIVNLTKRLDKILSAVILTSFFSNLYHLSLQLLRSLRISGTFFHKLYFYFSLSYLILRLLTTLFCMAEVREASQKSKDALFVMENHCTSSLRFLEQILTDDIHLTGNRTFTVTRAFVFSVIGTIVTYQVVLLQFDALAFVDT